MRQRYFGVNFALLNLGIGIGGILGGLLVDVDRLITFQGIYLADAASYLPPLFLLLVPLRHVPGRGAELHDDVPAAPPPQCSASAVAGRRSGVGVRRVQPNTGMPAFARAVGEISTRGSASPSRATRW